MNNPQDQNRSTQQSSSSMQQKAQDTASQVTDQVREKAGDVTDKARDTARTTAENQKGRVADSVGSVAHALRQTSQHLNDQDQGSIAHFTQMAADRLEQFSNDLQNKSVDEMVGDVEDFARRDPQLFLGGALVLGLLASRFFKSSARRSQKNWQGDYGQYDYGRRGYYNQGRGSQYGARYPSGQETYGGGYTRQYDQQDLADYRRDVMDNEYTGTGASGQPGYGTATTGQTGRSTGTTGQSTYGTGMGETSDSEFRPSSTTNTSDSSTGTGFNTPPVRKPGEQNPPNRTNE